MNLNLNLNYIDLFIYLLIFGEVLRFNLKISTLSNFFRVKKGNIGDLLDFDF